MLLLRLRTLAATAPRTGGIVAARRTMAGDSLQKNYFVEVGLPCCDLP